MSLNNSAIKVVSAKITGPFHLQKNMGCQDFFACKKNKNRIIAVVSDGAGTAKFSKIGAKTVCETLCDILINSANDNLKKDIIFALETAREKLLNHRYNKTKSEDFLINFAATVVGVVYYDNKGLFFHIGDGAAVAFFNDDLSSSKISKPENGIFSCETFFYTMDDWKDSLRFTKFEKAKQICLMTDGVTSFAFKQDFSDIEKKFMSPVLDFFNKTKSCKKSAKALLNTLSTQQAKKISSDDKTFVWIRL